MWRPPFVPWEPLGAPISLALCLWLPSREVAHTTCHCPEPSPLLPPTPPRPLESLQHQHSCLLRSPPQSHPLGQPALPSVIVQRLPCPQLAPQPCPPPGTYPPDRRWAQPSRWAPLPTHPHFAWLAQCLAHGRAQRIPLARPLLCQLRPAACRAVSVFAVTLAPGGPLRSRVLALGGAPRVFCFCFL